MKLWDFQEEAVEFVGRTGKAYLAMGLGTGKTLASLAAAAKHAKKNVLVIAEKNEIVNSKNFGREVTAHFPGMEYVNLREDEIPPKGEKRFVCGINPDGLVKLDLDAIAESFDTVIVDEATLAKTATSQRFRRVKKVCEMMKYVVLLSGTPMMNGAAELYAPLLIIGHPLAGNGSLKDRQAFESIFAGGHRRKIRNTGVWFKDYVWWAKGANNVRELRYLLRDHFFFKRKEDTSVFKYRPDRQIINVPMSIPWLVEYEAAWNEYLVKAKKRDVNMENVMELQALIENGQCYQVNSKWKAREVVRDIKDGKYGDQRIVVFSMFIETDKLLAELLTQEGILFKTFEDVREWKTGKEQVLLGRIKAHGKGTNLSEASVALFVDMDFVPANNVQAENRIDRPEQTKPMTVRYYLTEGNDIVDAHVRRINQDKTRKIDEFMRPLTPEEIKEMPGKIDALVVKHRKDFAVLGYPQGGFASVHG